MSINGQTVTQLGIKADPQRDTIAVDGEIIEFRQEFVYILLNKPRGYTSSTSDPHAKLLVTDLLAGLGKRIYPVGRLDVDTEGLLLLTNDGDFSLKVTHPSHHVPKTYQAVISGIIEQDCLEYLSKGVHLDDGVTSPAIIELRDTNPRRNTSTVEITIYEGKKRQVRRMFKAVGHPVIKLKRTKIGNISIGNMKPGEWRYLKNEEIDYLRSF